MELFSRKNLIWMAPLLVVLLVTPPFLVSYYVYLLNLIGIYIIVAIGLNLLTGYTGQIALGHAGFFAIGAYATANVQMHLGLPFYLAIIAGGLVAAVAGLIIGIPSLRLSGLYLAMATLAFGIVVEEGIIQLRPLTEGADGMSFPTASLLGYNLETDWSKYYFILIVTLAFIVLALNLTRTKTGRAMLALRESELAAETMGVNLTRYKTIAFVISAFYTGVGGGLYGYLLAFIGPENFDLFVSIQFITMIVVGGMGSILGSVLGAVFIIVVPELFAGLRDWQSFVFGAVMVVSIVYVPKGLAGLLLRILRRLGRLFLQDDDGGRTFLTPQTAAEMSPSDESTQ